MFKFPFNWLKTVSDTEISYDELLKWLSEQGFEIASLENVDDDTLIEIEVKANRPDMLSVAGVLREVYISKKLPAPKVFDENVELSFDADNKLSHEIKIESPDVHRYCGVEITGIDNTVETPAYILDVLNKLGVPHINPVVDISNYVLLLIGQPSHVFDTDKLTGAITVKNIDEPLKFMTLNGSETEFPKGALIISDDEKPICAAGMIGSPNAEITSDTKNIIIESANFDHIIIRTTSKKTHVSTMASYRYERGVDAEMSCIGARILTKMITDICGGKVNTNAYMHKDADYTPNVLKLTTERTNSILGTSLFPDEIADMLRRCYFDVKMLDGTTMEVTVPSFRLDVDLDVDLIEEVGRIYGYHNIEPQPIKLYAPYKENLVNKNANMLRNIMTGSGFFEVLTYGFIPSDAMTTLNINESSLYYGDIRILNPLSNYFELMRPTMAYNLIQTAVSNLALGKNDIKIFELGKTFKRYPGHADSYEDYTEKNMFGALLTGVKCPKGFGVAKEIKYSVYDAVAAVRSIFGEYNIPIEIKNTDSIGMFEPGVGAEILANGKHIGIIGKVAKKVLMAFENGKLAKDEVFYFEFCYEALTESKKSISYETSFPSVVREYNFIVKNGIHFTDYVGLITEASPLVVSAKPIDVYFGTGVEKGSSAVLINVEYNAVSRTLSAEEIEAVEESFKKALADKYGIELKK